MFQSIRSTYSHLLIDGRALDMHVLFSIHINTMDKIESDVESIRFLLFPSIFFIRRFPLSITFAFGCRNMIPVFVEEHKIMFSNGL